MTSSPSVSSYFPPPPDHLGSASLEHRPKTYDWTQSHELTKDLLEGRDAGHELSHSQDRTPPKDTTVASTTPIRRPGSGMQKLFSPSPLALGQTTPESTKMNPKSAAPSEPFISDETVTTSFRRASNRWSYNGSEKFVGPGVANWDLSEELKNRLKLGNGADDDDGSTTPPKTIVTDVHHIQEASPLDTSSSDTSLDSMSPQNVDTLNSHSRGASTDTLSSESSSRSSQVLLNSFKNPTFTADLTKDRPRSFSGAINDVELRRLQNIPTPSQLPESFLVHDRERASPLKKDANTGSGESKAPSSTASVENAGIPVQPMFASLSAYPPVQHVAGFAHGQSFPHIPVTRQDDLQINHGPTPNIPYPANGAARGVHFDNIPYRQHQVQVRPPSNVFQPTVQHPQATQNLMSAPTGFAYGHHNAISLGNQQQLYDMMVPPPIDPAISRAQQQTFRPGHQHSASDPASLRDAATLLMNMNGLHGIQGFPGSQGIQGMYPPAMGMFPNQFLPMGPTQQQNAVQYSQDMLNALNLNRTLQQQYTGNSTATATTTAPPPYSGSASPSDTASGLGPSANNRKLNLYKTELCRSWEEKGSCRYGAKCQFAHGEDEIRRVSRHPKYKTEICRTFWVSGSCPYGKRCCFIHTELPANGATPTGDDEGSAPAAHGVDGRGRSMSTTSDPTETPISLLQRIAKRTDSSTAAPMSAVDGQNYQFARPANGPVPLRVDTTVHDTVAAKPTKSAYPTFANSSMQVLSPGPVTAGPEFGRQNVGFAEMPPSQRMRDSQSTNPRHSYTGSETGVNFVQQQQQRSVSGGSSSPFGILSDGSTAANASGHHGHSRSGSASTWGSFSQRNNLAASPYTHTPSPGHDFGSGATVGAGSPWSSQDLNAGERAWA